MLLQARNLNLNRTFSEVWEQGCWHEVILATGWGSSESGEQQAGLLQLLVWRSRVSRDMIKVAPGKEIEKGGKSTQLQPLNYLSCMYDVA